MSKYIKAGCVVVHKFVSPGTGIYRGYIEYMDRDNATRNDAVCRFSAYADYMGNPEKTSNMFDSKSDEIPYIMLDRYKELYEEAQENGSPLWQTVISFDNRWLEENNMIDKETGILLEDKLKAYTRTAVNKMLNNENMPDALWTAAIHYNTDNIHVHVGTVEVNPTREQVEVKTIRFPANWVNDHNIMKDIAPPNNDMVKLYADNAHIHREAYTRLTYALMNDTGKEFDALPKFGEYIRINADNSIDLSFQDTIENIPPMADLIENRLEYRGTFKEKSIKSCRSSMVNNIIKDSLENDKINNIIRNVFVANLKDDPLWQNKDLVKQYLKVYNALPNDKRKWKYNMNSLNKIRPEIDKLTELWINKYYSEEYQELQTLLFEQEQQYITAYGQRSLISYTGNKYDDMKTRCGNVILKNMLKFSFDDLREWDFEKIIDSESKISNSYSEQASENIFGAEISLDDHNLNGIIEETEFEIDDATIGEIFDIPNEELYVDWSDEYKNARKYLFSRKYKNKLIKPDYDKANQLLINEAALGNAYALFDLAQLYSNSNTEYYDKEQSSELYTKALEGFEIALLNPPPNTNEKRLSSYKSYLNYRIGKMYGMGLGTDIDYKKSIDFLEKTSNGYSQYTLGTYYEYGYGVNIDYNRAFEFYKQSHTNNQGKFIEMPFADYNAARLLEKGVINGHLSSEADSYYKHAFSGFYKMNKDNPDDKLQYRLGIMLLKGKGTEKNYEKAIEFLEMSAESGNTYAQCKLAIEYMSDKNISSEKIDKAYSLLGRSATKGNNETAQYHLGKLHINPKSKFFDVQKGIRYLKLADAQNNKFAQYQLGKEYLSGKIIEKDEAKAVEYFMKSANQEMDAAQYQLGKIHLKNNNIDTAIKYFTQAADNSNNPFAQYKLGKIYSTEKYNHIDIYKALLNFEKAIGQGNEFAAYQTGIIYTKGEHIKADNQKALEYFNTALELSQIENSKEDNTVFKSIVDYQIGVIYLKGKDGIKQDSYKAIEHLTKSAEEGNNQFAQYQLGKLYLFGNKQIAPDKKLAEQYLNASVAQGNEYAQALLDWKPTRYAPKFIGNPGLENAISRLLQELAYDQEEEKARMFYERLKEKEEKQNQPTSAELQ